MNNLRQTAVVEHRDVSSLCLRLHGNRLEGIAVRYNEIAPQFNERIEPGAFGNVQSIAINLQHDASVVLVENATLQSDNKELRVLATLQPDAAAIRLVERGALNGFSVEFVPVQDRMDGNVRVIERAKLVGLALVDMGAYPSAKPEVRENDGKDTEKDAQNAHISNERHTSDTKLPFIFL